MLPLNNSEIKSLSPSTITRVSFGVRYEPQFRLMDEVGAVTDAVLRTKGTPFGPDVFTNAISSATERALVNPDDGSLLRLTHTDAILQMPFSTRNMDRIRELGEDFERYVLRPLAEIPKISGIARYGVLLNFDQVRHLKDRPTVHYLGREFPDANSLAMRFTRRLPVDEALFRKEVDDYRNAIYTLSEDNEGTVSMSIDYQEYFRPPLDAKDWADKPFDKFINRGIAYFENDFQRWFTGLAEVAEVA